MIRLRNIGIVVPLAMLVAGCPTVPPEEDPVLIKLTELEDRLQRVERVVNNDSLLDLNSQVTQMRAEVNELRGSVETNRFDLDGAMDRNREQYIDLDGRIEALQRSGVIGAGGSGIAAVGDDPRAVYEQAFDLLKARRYPEAQAGFQDFLTRFPDNALVDNAYYWLGETSYVSGDFEGAVTHFNNVVENFPTSGKVDDALLKIGFSQYEQSEFKDARTTLERVVAEFPDTTSSRLATQRLEQMTGEGR